MNKKIKTSEKKSAVESPEKDFSIILPSRDRQVLLENLLRSIEELTNDINKIEVLIAIDDDDLKTKEFLDRFNFEFVKHFVVKRTTNFSRDYYNYLFNQSSGKWVVALNDDAVFMTKNWDLESKKVLNQHGGIVYGWIEDNLGEARGRHIANYSCWPLLGRKGVEALGYFFPERIPMWGSDIWVTKLYSRLGKVVELPMRVNHVCHHNGTRERDELNVRVGNNSGTYSVEPSSDEVSKLLKDVEVEVACR